MSDYQTIQVRGTYRSSSHLPVWQLMHACGIAEQVGLEMVGFTLCQSARTAESDLLSGEVDFVSGNHVSPYTRYLQGLPLVYIASPSNGVRYTVASRQPLASLSDARGLRLGETSPWNPGGSLQHIRGNHILYLRDAGLSQEDVTWVNMADQVKNEEEDEVYFQALRDNRIDFAFVQSGRHEEYRAAGYSILPLAQLPMINGPTLTTTLTNLERKDRLGERLVKALVMSIHYAHAHTAEATAQMRAFAERHGQPALSAERVKRLARKPYPTPEAVNNAYELACIQTPSTRGQGSPLALWDLHYLREIDQSGFIDQLYTESAAVPAGA